MRARGISKIISTGSKGNAVLHNTILVDCGVPVKDVEDIIDSVEALFITHRHTDHWKKASVKYIAKMNKPIYINKTDKIFFNKHLGKDFTKEYVTYFEVKGDLIEIENSLIKTRIKTDFLKHDCPNYCLRINIETKGIHKWTSIFHATDTGSIDHVTIANACDWYFIEANYQTHILNALSKSALQNGNFDRYQRSKSTHLSKKQCDNFYKKNRKATSRLEYLHQSDKAF